MDDSLPIINITPDGGNTIMGAQSIQGRVISIDFSREQERVDRDYQGNIFGIQYGATKLTLEVELIQFELAPKQLEQAAKSDTDVCGRVTRRRRLYKPN